MPSYTKQIEEALAQAPPVRYEHGVAILAIAEPRDYRLQGLDDLSPMQCGYATEVPPAAIAVKTPAELENVYQELTRIANTGLGSGHEERKILDDGIQTQIEHAYIANWLGAEESRHLLSIHGYNPSLNTVAWSFTHQTLRLTTTRIGNALLSVYPAVLSISGLLDIQALDYESIDDVGQRAEKYALPLPLSYKAPQGHV